MKNEPIRNRLPRFDMTEVTYFITAVTQNRYPYFAKPKNTQLLLDTLRNVQKIYPFKMRGYVILPDHSHLQLTLKKDARISQVIKSLKRNYTVNYKRENNIAGQLKLWQHRFYDHVIRDQSDYVNHLNYIHYNPVKHGLVAKPEDYKFSSYLDYVNREWYELGWGHQEIPYKETENLGGE